MLSSKESSLLICATAGPVTKRNSLPKGSCVNHGHNRTGDEEKCPAKLPWEKMELTYKGNIAEIIQIGGGKLTRSGGDPGEARKTRGHDHHGLADPFAEPMPDSLSNPLSTPFDPLSKP